MTDTDYAWAAGFFDGEGCIYAQGASNLFLCLTSTSRKSLHRLNQIFPGAIYPRKRCGATLKPQWTWVIGKRSTAYAVLDKMLPYLIEKHREAELALTWLEAAPVGWPTDESDIRRERLARMLKRAKRITKPISA